MFNKDKVVVVIPARSGSKRLKDKNIYPVKNKPMLAWAIDASKKSKYADDIFVTSDSEEYLAIANEWGARAIKRPESISDDKTFKMKAIQHAVQQIPYRPEIVVSLQANSPEVTGRDIDRCIEVLSQYRRNEIISVDENLMQNAAIRVMKYNTVFQDSLSTTCGVCIVRCTDVHTKDDVELVEFALGKKNES